MKLRELIAGAGLVVESRFDDADISDLAYASKSVTEGALFFCVPGAKADGHDYAAEAIGNGAVALVCSRPLQLDVPQVLVEDVRRAMPPIAATFFDEPSEQLRMVGVTGTNGKTTTAFLVRHLLESAGVQTGMLGTVQSVIGGVVRDVERTTPEAIDLQRAFRQMLNAGDEACVIEVSSHALELHRVDAVAFDTVVFTNLTQDHLDFHGTLDRYFGAKRSLFLPEDGARPTTSVVNLDDEWGRRLAAEVAEVGQTHLVTYAVDNDADYRAGGVSSGATGCQFELAAPNVQFETELPLPGIFNVYNALAALAAAVSCGLALPEAVVSLAQAPNVPGRMEPVYEGQRFAVLVDYAHTPDSLENVLLTARELLDVAAPDGRLICVFGAGGDRDPSKRAPMGEAAAASDIVVVTSDNPRSEDPTAIIADVLRGVARAAAPETHVEVEPDRGKAIEWAVGQARPGDIVMVAGKGHEQGQEFEDGRKLPFDDREVTRNALRALAAARADA